METFAYRTVWNGEEFRHTIYANSIEESLKNWILEIKDLVKYSHSFSRDAVSQILSLYENEKLELLKKGECSFYCRYLINDTPVITYIDELINKQKAHFMAIVTFKSAIEGGRDGYTKSGYRPQFRLEKVNMETATELIYIDM